MHIISHRGYWLEPNDKNTLISFERSFQHGFGIETDIRDCDGRMVISHDPADSTCPGLEDVLALHNLINPELPLALNIKSDGLFTSLLSLLSSFQVKNYFVFDMSIPDTLGYLQNGINYFTRQSEYEPVPSLYETAAGVWMDCFNSEWMTETQIAGHLAAGKQLCLVSPELHKRDHRPFWNRLSAMMIRDAEGLMLCTDFPQEAREYLHGTN